MKKKSKLNEEVYLKELEFLQNELVKLQDWIRTRKLRVVVIFEGRDAAGKGGTIKRITEKLNPRVCRIVALPKPTEKEQTQWFFQRYVKHLPSGGEMVLFDRSWYNRAVVDKVMDFCTEEEYREFLRSCPDFEAMLIRSGIILIKYWFSVSGREQEKRFRDRLKDPSKRWKFSDFDLRSFLLWNEISKVRDEMMDHTHTPLSPWYIVRSDNKRRARLNCMRHLIGMIPFEEIPQSPVKLPRRPDNLPDFSRSRDARNKYVPERY